MTENQMLAEREVMWEDAKSLEELPASTPLPALRRWIVPEEAGAVWAGCMTEAGLPFKAGPYSDVVYAGPAQHGEWIKDPKIRLSMAICVAQFTIDPRTRAPYTPTTTQALWFYYHDYAVPCLEEHGFAPDAPLPGMADYGTNPDGWQLYPETSDPHHPLTDEIKKMCSLVPFTTLLNP